MPQSKLLGPAIIAQGLAGGQDNNLSAAFQLMQQRRGRERQTALDQSLINSRLMQNKIAQGQLDVSRAESPSLIGQRTAATAGATGRETRAAGLFSSQLRLADITADEAAFDLANKQADVEAVKADMISTRERNKNLATVERQLFEQAQTTGNPEDLARYQSFAFRQGALISTPEEKKKQFNRDPYVAWATGFGTHRVSPKNEPILDVIANLKAGNHPPILRDFLVDNAGTAMMMGLEIDPITNIPEVAEDQQEEWLIKSQKNLADLLPYMTLEQSDIAIEDTISKVSKLFGISPEGKGELKKRTDVKRDWAGYGQPSGKQTYTGFMQELFKLQGTSTSEEVIELLAPQIAESLGLPGVPASIKRALAKGTPAIDIKRAEQKRLKEEKLRRSHAIGSRLPRGF